ncbi:tetratricopeptide repeat protein (macronuclear) [Tetrahymena thermophila SB210]|uniref:Tetratricopeptide repeat protein n=1 Tax=Tetrahymena thermophila (strain SB210) TaxID=312017 RepID=Q245F7_TETTS|nr:tetratricopeptide repeat protein [Tetrahymena thermophila SB210]EAS03407.2 tetratricopeptide repeat protein [Tetrahymena thermophila SB210]|eukprot:XP_001023652.2 tetratricopeptide repeat protein [Tetrahymena thermophila SB210]
MKIRPLSPISLIQTSAQKSISDNQLKDDIESNTSMVIQNVQNKNSAEQFQIQQFEQQQKQSRNQHETFSSSYHQTQLQKKSLKQISQNPSQKKLTNNNRNYEKIDQRILKAIESINYYFNKGIQMQQKQWDHFEKLIQEAMTEANQSNQLSSITYTIKKLNINAMQQIEKAGNINQASKILNFCSDLLDNFGNLWIQSNLRNSQLSIPSTQTPKSNGFSSNFEMSKQKLSNQNFGLNFSSVLSETLICLKSLTMNNQGTVFRRKGQFQAALEIFNEALNILSNAKRKEYLGLTYLNLSILYSSLGNHNMSLENANNALIEQQRLFYEKNYTTYLQKQNSLGFYNGENLQSLALSPKSSLTNLANQVKENQKQESSDGSTPKNRNKQILNQISAQKLNSKEDFSRTMEKNFDSTQEISYSDLYFYDEEREDEFLQQVNTLGISYYNIAAELEYFQRWDEAHRHYEYSYTSTKKYFGEDNCITLQFYEEYKLFQSRHAKRLVEDNINELKHSPQKFANSVKSFTFKERPQSQKRKLKLEAAQHIQTLGNAPQTITKESERGSQQTPSRKNRQFPTRHRSLHINQNTVAYNSNQLSHIQNQNSFQQTQNYPLEQNFIQNQTPTNRNVINFTNKSKRNIVSASKSRVNLGIQNNNQSSNFFNPITPKTSHSRINSQSNHNQIIQGPYLFQPSYSTNNTFGGNGFTQQANSTSSGNYGFQSFGNSLLNSPKNMMLTQQAKNFSSKTQPITNLQAQKANLIMNQNVNNQQNKLIEKIKQLSSNKQRFQFNQIDNLKMQFETTPKEKNQYNKKFHHKNKSETSNLEIFANQMNQDSDQGKSNSQSELNEQLFFTQNNVSSRNQDNLQQQIQSNKKALNQQNDNNDISSKEKQLRNNIQQPEKNQQQENQQNKLIEHENYKPKQNFGSNKTEGSNINKTQSQKCMYKQITLQEKLKESANTLREQMILEYNQNNTVKNGHQLVDNGNINNIFQLKDDRLKQKQDGNNYSSKEHFINRYNHILDKKKDSTEILKNFYENNKKEHDEQANQQKQLNKESKRDTESNDDVFDLEKSQLSNKSLNEENLKKLIKTLKKQNKLQEKDKKFIQIILMSKNSQHKQNKQKNDIQDNNQHVNFDNLKNGKEKIQQESTSSQQFTQNQNQEININNLKQIIYQVQNKSLHFFSVEDSNKPTQRQSQIGNLTFTLLNQTHLISSFSWVQQKTKDQIILLHSFDVSEVYQQIQWNQSSQFQQNNQMQDQKRAEKNNQFQLNKVNDQQNQNKVEGKNEKQQSMKHYLDILTQLSNQISNFLIISPLMNFLLVDSNPSTPNRLKISLQNVGIFSIVNFADDQSLVNFVSAQQGNQKSSEEIEKQANQKIQFVESKQEKQNDSTVQPLPLAQQQKIQISQQAPNIPLSSNSLTSNSPKSSSSNLGIGSHSNFQLPSQSHNQLALEQIDELEELKPILNHKKNGNKIVQSKSKQNIQEQQLTDISNSSITPIVSTKYNKTRPKVKSQSSLSKLHSEKKEIQPKVSSAMTINPIIKHFQDCSPINNLGSPFVSAYDADPTFTNYLKDITPILQENQKNNTISATTLQPITQPKQSNNRAQNKEYQQETNTVQTPEQQLQQIQAIITLNKQNQDQDLIQQNLQQQQNIFQQSNFQNPNIQQLQYLYSNQNLVDNLDYINQLNQLQYPQYFNENGQFISQDNFQLQQPFDDRNLNPYSNQQLSQNLQQNNFNNPVLTNFNFGIEENNLNQIQQQYIFNNQMNDNYFQQMVLPQLSQQQQYYQTQQNTPQYNQYTPEEQFYQNNLLFQQQQQQQILLNQYQLQQMIFQNQISQQQQQAEVSEIPKTNLEQLQTTTSNEIKLSVQKEQSKQSQIQSQQSQLQSQQSLPQEAQNSINSPSQKNLVQSQNSKQQNSQVDYSQNSYLQTINSPLKSQDQSLQNKLDQINLDTQQSNNVTIQKVESQLGYTPVNFSRQTFQLDSHGFEKLNIQNPMISTNNSLVGYDKNSARSLTDLNIKLDQDKRKSTNKNHFRNKYQSRASIACLPSTLAPKQDNNGQRRYSQFYMQTLQKLQQQELESQESESSNSSKESDSSNSQDQSQINDPKKEQFQQNDQNMEVKQTESKIEDENNEQEDQNVSVILKDSQFNKLRANNKTELSNQSPNNRTSNNNNSYINTVNKQNNVSNNNKILKQDQDYYTQNDDCDDDEENDKIKQQFDKEDVLTRIDSENDNNFIQDDYSQTQKKNIIHNIQDISQIKHKRNDFESIKSDDWNEFKSGKQIFRNQSNESNIYSYFSGNQNISQINKNMNEEGYNFPDLDYSNPDNNYEDTDLQKSGIQSTSQINFTKKNNISSQTSVQSNDPNIQMNDNNQPISDINLKSDGQNSQTSDINNQVKDESPKQVVQVQQKVNTVNQAEPLSSVPRAQKKKQSVPQIFIFKVSTQEDINQEDQSSSDSSDEEDEEEEHKHKEFQTDEEDTSQEIEEKQQIKNVNSLENLKQKDDETNNQYIPKSEIRSFNTNTASNSTISQNERKQSLKELEKIEKKEQKKRDSLRKLQHEESLSDKLYHQYSSFRSVGTEQPSARFQSPEKSMQESQGSKKQFDLKLKIEESDPSPLPPMRGKSESLMIKSEDNRAMTPKIKEKRRDSLLSDLPNFQNQLQILEQAALESSKVTQSLTNIKETDEQRQRRESIKNGIVPDFGNNWSTSNLQSKMAMIEENNADSDNVDSEGEGKFQRRRQSTLAQNRPKMITFESNIRIHTIQQNLANEYHDQQSPYFTVNANGTHVYGSQNQQNYSHHDKPSDPQQVRGKTFTFDYNYQNDSIRAKGNSKSQFHNFFQFPSEENIKYKDEQSTRNQVQSSLQDLNQQQQKQSSQTNIQFQQSQNQSMISQQNTPLSSIKSNTDTQNHSGTQIFSQFQSKNYYSNSNLDSVSPNNQTTPNHQSSKSNFSYSNLNNKNSNMRFEDIVNQNN